MRYIKWVIISSLIVVSAGCVLRPSLGRSRPDLAALLSFDGEPLTFERTYTSGNVGPFTIGDTRLVTMQRLSTEPLRDRDMELHGTPASWTAVLPARSGGSCLYTLNFEGERLTKVKAFYSVWAT